MKYHVAVIGAGIVGTAAALQLARDGQRVTLLDRGAPGGATSHGNAGGIVPSSVPMATPGTLRSVPGMLLDPDAPLSVRWRNLPELLPWFARFVAECAPGRLERNSQALWALTSQTPGAWRDFIKGTSAEDLMIPRGWLKVYETDSGFQHTAAERELATRRGAAVALLDQAELRQLEPALAPIFRHGVLLTDGLFCRNPRRLVECLASDVSRYGGTFLQADVADVRPGESEIEIQLRDGTSLRADKVVISAGVFSRALALRTGLGIPLAAERGYHIMLDAPGQPTNGPIVWGEKGFVLCPMETGMRVTSQAEFASIGAPPDYRRIERTVHHATRMLPGLSGTIRERWMGHRPSTPDTLPVIGPSPLDDRILFAFGHSHYGLTLAAVTAGLVSDLVALRDPRTALEAYRAVR